MTENTTDAAPLIPPVGCATCGEPAVREFCYAAEPWVPYCQQHEPQYATVGKRPIQTALVPPVGEDDPLKKLRQIVAMETYELGGTERVMSAIVAALTLTRQQQAEQTRTEVEKACAAERAEIAHDIEENPNSTWTATLRLELDAQHEEIAALTEIAEKGRYRDAAEFHVLRAERELERAIAAESREAALRAELAETKNDARRERCDKCGLLVHYSQIAIEVKDGAPIDDRAGFMWCHACHCRRIIEAARQEIETLKQEQGK